MIACPNPIYNMFLVNNVLLEHITLICLYSMYRSIHLLTAGMYSCNKDHMATKTKISLSGFLQRKFANPWCNVWHFVGIQQTLTPFPLRKHLLYIIHMQNRKHSLNSFRVILCYLNYFVNLSWSRQIQAIFGHFHWLFLYLVRSWIMLLLVVVRLSSLGRIIALVNI